MMLTTALPLLPPPATSLLPSLYNRPRDDPSTAVPLSLQAQQQQQQQRRHRTQHGLSNSKSQLSMLAADERTIASRKQAIAMYGYSWLKPAGCTKTMLGRREEEIEREEVERQLREVEVQERNALEMEEAERQARLEQQGEREGEGEDVGEGEQDLDADLPDMDALSGEFDEDEEDEEGDMDGDEVDLDDDVPDADVGDETGFTYDTNRDSDSPTDSEEGDEPRPLPSAANRGNIPRQPRGGLRTVSLVENHERAEQEALVDAMLDEDELGEYGHQRDLDDDIPDLDMDRDLSAVHDLDDDIPSADDASEDGGWEHTDTELEESDMDISILPPGITAHGTTNDLNTRAMPPPPTSARRSRPPQPQRRERDPRYSTASASSAISSSGGLRRSSGNVPHAGSMLPPPSTAPRQGMQQRHGGNPRHRQPQAAGNEMYTPDYNASDFSVSALLSTGDSSLNGRSDARHTAAGGASRLDVMGARRNLFGGAVSGTAQEAAQRQTSRGVAASGSGGLFTPPTRNLPNMPPPSIEEPRSRTRSGRVIGGNAMSSTAGARNRRLH